MDGKHGLEETIAKVDPSPIRTIKHRIKLRRLQRPNIIRLSGLEHVIKLINAT